MDQLPNEVLLEIFHYLDKSTLKKVINISQRYRTVVSLSSKLTKSIDLTVNPSCITSLLNSNDFPYYSLMLDTVPNKTSQGIFDYERDIAKFAKQNPTIQWTEVKFINERYLKTLVAPFENLVQMNLISNIEAPFVDPSPKWQSSFKNLKFLGIKGATNMLQLIKDHQVHTFKVIDTLSPQVNRNLTEFFKSAHHLKIVKFMGFIPVLSDISDYKFNLESFSLLLKGQLPTASDSIYEFIQHHSSSMVEMKLIGFNTCGFVEYAINEMKLRKFEVDLTKLRRNLDEIKENLSIKRVMLQFTYDKIPNVINVLEKCRGVEDLKIVSNTSADFSQWFGKIPENLKKLEIDTILSENLPKVTFKHIKVLKFCKISDDHQARCWLEIASKCLNVTKIIISGWNQIVKLTGREEVEEMPKIKGSLFFKTLESLKHLEEIQIEGNYQMTDEIIFALVTFDKLNEDAKLRKFKFCTSEVNSEDLRERVRILEKTNIQCTIMPEVKEAIYNFKNLKRRQPDC